MNLSYDEIKNGDTFEDLVAEYFKHLKTSGDSSVLDVSVKQSGIGTDGGRDILVETTHFDKIVQYTRKWVVQCKFHNSNISPNKINSINIPTLIHSYKANGYLLVCRKNATVGVTDLFDRLKRECTHGYKYEVWSGNELLMKISSLTEIQKVFFPKYYQHIDAIRGQR